MGVSDLLLFPYFLLDLCRKLSPKSPKSSELGNFVSRRDCKHYVDQVGRMAIAFIRLILAIKVNRIVAQSGAATIRGQSLSSDAWQGKFDPIAERVSQLTTGQPDPLPAFYAGIAAIFLNLLAFSLLKRFLAAEVLDGTATH